MLAEFILLQKVAEMEGIQHPLAPNMGPLTKKVQQLSSKAQGKEAGTEKSRSKYFSKFLAYFRLYMFKSSLRLQHFVTNEIFNFEH